MQQEEYVAHDGKLCPNCGSNQVFDVEGEFFQKDSLTVIAEVACQSCGQHWFDEYTLSSFELIETQPEYHDTVELGDGYVRIYDGEGEVVTWIETEWIDDPNIVPSMLNAVNIAHTQGPEAVRKLLNR